MLSTEEQAAAWLWRHWQAGSAVDALPEPLRPQTRARGYAIRAAWPQAAGRAVVGWKIAATSAGGQAHIGVSGPLAGRVLEGTVHADGATVSLEGRRMPLAEPELAFRFGRAIAPRSASGTAPYTMDEALDAVEALQHSIEVPDSRYADFVRAGEAQLIADNACAYRFVLGADAPGNWRELDLTSHRVVGEVFGADGQRRVHREGTGGAVLGDPRIALTWFVNELSAPGVPIAAGQWVSTGPCMVPLEVLPGDRVRVDCGVLGSMGVRFADRGQRRQICTALVPQGQTAKHIEITDCTSPACPSACGFAAACAARGQRM